MNQDDPIRIPVPDMSYQYSESYFNELRNVGNLQPGPRQGELTPKPFRPDINYTITDAPDQGDLSGM